jgi:pantoate--beta-alanine ligase
MSSRNVRLNEEARHRAGLISKMLAEEKSAFESSEAVEQIQERVFSTLRKENFEPEYFEIVNGYTLEPIRTMQDAEQVVACCAVKVEGVRLIDNMIWK